MSRWKAEQAAARLTLHAALRRGEWPEEAIGRDVLLDASRFHGLDHVLSAWLESTNPGHPAIDALRTRTRAAARFDLVVVGALREALLALPCDLPVAVMKGPVHAQLQRTIGGTRAYADLDLLVSPERLREAIDALRAVNAIAVPSNWATLTATRHAQIPVRLPLGIDLDLHWHLNSRPHTRQAFRIAAAEELLARRESFDLAIGSVPVLERHDMLLHTAAHAGWSGLDRLGWFADVDAVIRALPPDWDILVRRAREWRIERMVADALERTKQTVGTPVPAEALHALRGRHVSLAATADRVAPPEMFPRSRSPGRYLRTEHRGSAVATLYGIAILAVKAISRRLPTTGNRPVDEPPENERDPRVSPALDEANYYAFTRHASDEIARRARRTRRRDAAVVFPSMLALTVRCRRRLRSTPDLNELLAGLDDWSRSHPRRQPRSSAAIVAGTVRSLRLLGATNRSCVLQSLVIYTEITRSKTSASFVSGFVKVGSGLDGHAWVESTVLPAELTNDAHSSERFRVGFRHPSPEPSGRSATDGLRPPTAWGGLTDDHIPVVVSLEDGNLVWLPLDRRN